MRMLSHCVVFLCFGAFISCRPTENIRTKSDLTDIVKEALGYLTVLVNKEVKETPQDSSTLSSETTLMVPKSWKKECEFHDLKKFSAALESVVPKGSKTAFDSLQRNIKDLIKYWPNPNDTSDCSTGREIVQEDPLKKLQQFLVELRNSL